MSPARKVAFQVLLLVERGGYASDLLRSRSDGLDARDAGLASEIVYGCLRLQGQLDFLIQHFSGWPAARLDREIRLSLRMGIYQLLNLDRVPAHAAVTESVELVKRARKRSAAGFVNAVLRKVDRGQVPWPDRATELSLPPWLLERWVRQYGPDIAGKIGQAFLDPPVTYVRIPSGNVPPGMEAEPASVPGCYRLVAGSPGDYRIQDISSQSIVPMLDLRPGLRFLDVCAAPGNKTAQALESGVRAVACDLHHSRLAGLKTLDCDLVAMDGAVSLPFRARFDRILLDVPCSGTGTLGRNPEIKWRLRPEDPARLHLQQVKLLTNAIEHLAPGGKLVYSTCSLESEENEAVLEEVLGNVPEKKVRRLPGIDAGDGFFAAVIGSA
jgi:16S rRNA (cytosine967-C5)-methyltransferase